MRYVAAISYDGTNYAGWQRQKNALSVQEALENAMQKAFHQEFSVTASGRTDAGVHAERQIVHFDADLTLPPERLPEALNRFLPEDISVIDGAFAKEGFDANRTAKRKTYRYSFYLSKRRLPLKERYAVRLDSAPKKEALLKAAKLMQGEHDFKAFCAANSSVKTTVRTVYEVRIEDKTSVFCGENVREIDVFVTGNGFLYNMVRTMAGELLAIASGRRTEESLLAAFALGERELLDKTMPAKGLTMIAVEYGFNLFEKERCAAGIRESKRAEEDGAEKKDGAI